MDFFKNLNISITKYDDDFSVRFYHPQDKMSLGVIRLTNHNNNLITTSMNINDIIQYIMVTNNLPVEMGDTIVMTIRNKTIDEINKYLNGGNNDNIPDSIGTE
jgi:hypothetical protein